jgi:hypothetical protein
MNRFQIGDSVVYEGRTYRFPGTVCGITDDGQVIARATGAPNGDYAGMKHIYAPGQLRRAHGAVLPGRGPAALALAPADAAVPDVDACTHPAYAILSGGLHRQDRPGERWTALDDDETARLLSLLAGIPVPPVAVAVVEPGGCAPAVFIDHVPGKGGTPHD